MNDNILYIVGLLSIVSLLCVRAFYIKKMSALKSKNSELTEVISDFEKIKSQLLILKEKQMASVKNDVDTESDVVERVENVENMENVAVVSDMELDFDDISDVNDDDTLKDLYFNKAVEHFLLILICCMSSSSSSDSSKDGRSSPEKNFFFFFVGDGLRGLQRSSGSPKPRDIYMSNGV